MADILNLKAARKRKLRAEAERQAAENRARFGRPKAERSLARREGERAQKAHEGRKLELDLPSSSTYVSCDQPLPGELPMSRAIPFAIRGLDHVVLRVRDVVAMERFYCAVIGCSPERRQEKLGLIQLRAGSTLIDLVDVAGAIGREGGATPGREGRNMDHFCLRIDPFDAEAIGAHLKAHGVKAETPQPRFGADGEGPSIYLEDPEGNRVELKGPPQS